MNVNSNGIRVVTAKRENQRREPLEYVLDEVTFYKKEMGQIVTIVVPKFSHLKKALYEDGWKKFKNN